MQMQHVTHCYQGKSSTLHLYDLRMYQSNLQSLHFSTLDANLNTLNDIIILIIKKLKNTLLITSNKAVTFTSTDEEEPIWGYGTIEQINNRSGMAMANKWNSNLLLIHNIQQWKQNQTTYYKNPTL